MKPIVDNIVNFDLIRPRITEKEPDILTNIDREES